MLLHAMSASHVSVLQKSNRRYVVVNKDKRCLLRPSLCFGCDAVQAQLIMTS